MQLARFKHEPANLIQNTGSTESFRLSSNTFTYDENGNRLTSTAWRRVNGVWTSATTTNIYDAMNRVVQAIDPDGGTNTVVYNLIGQQQATIDKLGRTTSYTYDYQGRLIQTTYPDLTTETNGYDATGNRIASADRLGRVTSYVYDALNRLVQTIYPDGTTNTTVYDDVGRVAQTIDARGTITSFAYDAAGQRTAVTNAFGMTVQTVSTYGYDADGNQITFTDANNHTTTNVFDELNRQVEVDFPDGTKAYTAYDADGRRVAETNQDGIVTWFGYDGAGRLTSVTNALNQVTRYQYDEAGNEISQIDALNRTNTFAYDALERRTKHTMPGGQSEGFAYDIEANLIYQTNFNGAVITNQYDALNRLTNCSSVNGYSVSYTYTATGQRATMSDPSGTTSYSYDNRDRLLLKGISWNNGPSVSLNYLYDANGNVSNIWSSTPNGVNLAYGYDPLSRLTNVLANGNVAAGYTFDNVGNLQSLRYGNGVTNFYQYDSLNRLTTMVWRTNGTPIASFAYTLGTAGNRTALSETVSTLTRNYTWQYDNLYRLTNEFINTAGNLGYGYDPVGNRTNRQSSVSQLPTASYAYNTNDWLTSDQYDANGNTTNSAGVPYRYNVENQLLDYNNGAVTLGYNGDGIRVVKNVGGQVTFFVVDDRNPSGYVQVLEEITAWAGATNLTKVYAYGLDLLSQRQPGVFTNFYGYDGHGSVRFLTDSGGNVTDTYVYDAYGTLISSTGHTDNNYLYCGEQYDPHLHFYYLRARYLNPDTGRFWTMDSDEGGNEDPLSLHKYLYCQADPVNKIDPTGHMTVDELKEKILSHGEQAMEAVQDALKTIAEGGANAEALSGGLASFGVALIPDIMLNKVLDKAAVYAKTAEIRALYAPARNGSLAPRGPLPIQAEKENFLQYGFGDDKSNDKTGFAPLELSLSTSTAYSFVPFYVRWHELGSSTAAVTLFPWQWDKTLKKFTPALSNPFPIENYPSSVWFHSTGFHYTIEVYSPFGF